MLHQLPRDCLWTIARQLIAVDIGRLSRVCEAWSRLPLGAITREKRQRLDEARGLVWLTACNTTTLVWATAYSCITMYGDRYTPASGGSARAQLRQLLQRIDQPSPTDVFTHIIQHYCAGLIATLNGHRDVRQVAGIVVISLADNRLRASICWHVLTANKRNYHYQIETGMIWSFRQDQKIGTFYRHNGPCYVDRISFLHRPLGEQMPHIRSKLQEFIRTQPSQSTVNPNHHASLAFWRSLPSIKTILKLAIALIQLCEEYEPEKIAIAVSQALGERNVSAAKLAFIHRLGQRYTPDLARRV